MITRYGNLFHLETAKTSYVFKVLKSGHLQHLYYGKHITIVEESDGEALAEKQAFLLGNTNAYNEENPALTLEDICLEMSSYGKGDIREPFVTIRYADGSSTSDFLFEKAEITDDKPEFETLPGSYDDGKVRKMKSDHDAESTDSSNTANANHDKRLKHLTIFLKEASSDITLELHYYVYPDCDIIARSSRLVNNSKDPVKIERLMSMQLDFERSNYCMTTFGGGWAREMKKSTFPLVAGRHVNQSLTGTSSSRANPFVMIHGKNTTENSGEVYAFNLIYSGNHYEAAEVSSFGKLRFVAGINPEMFDWKLEPGKAFEAPESFMTYSRHGFNGMSYRMHYFIRNHIVRGNWKYKKRPVLVNSWEAMYFKVSESKLLDLAKAGADLGAELFVLDDGWFGERNDDKHSLGDWVPNKKKFPNGLSEIVDEIKDMGMRFGIWVEPEMVNTESDLYRAHPDWDIDIPGRAHSEGRNQRLLDLTRKDVQDYIIEAMRNVFSSADISYVKWDMNRTFTDVYSKALPADQQGEVIHRYYIGLYRIMKTLTTEFPDILFEGCSAGGNRFDAGILCYFPQIWASDDTDAIVRAESQTNYSYGYPQSVIGCHVSSCPNHQTLRETPLATRFNTAAFGVLGYEMNLNDLSDKDKKAIREQIEFYKNNWKLFQFGRFYRGRYFGDEGYAGVLAHSDNDITEWTVVSRDKAKAAGAIINKLAVPNAPSEIYFPRGLAADKRYHFYNIKQKINIMEYGELINTASPIHIKNGSIVHQIVANVAKMEGETEDYTANGDLLMGGVRLKPAYSATGLDDNIRHFPDFASRMYMMEEVK